MSLDAIGIVSEDPTRAVAFYKLLGIELVAHGGADHYEATTPSGVRIMLDSLELIRSFEPSYEKVRGSGVIMCFKQASAKTVDELHAAITKAGHKSIKAPWDAFWGQRYACVADPDGNQVDLFAPL
jgi:uncharacterized glyoxalase superfamily protein PhnB